MADLGISKLINLQFYLDAVEQTNSILKDGSEAILAFDRDWRFVYINYEAEKLFHVKREEYLGKKLWEVYPTDTIYYEKYSKAMNEKVFVQFNARGICNDIWVGTRVYPFLDGICVFFKDVTDRIELEQQLKESETRYKALFDHSPEPMVVHLHDKYLFANEAAARLYGLSKLQELIGRDITEFIHPDYVQAVHERSQGLVQRQEVAPLFELKIVTVNGEVRDVQTIAIPFEYKGEIASQVVLRDITQQKRMEEILRANEEKLNNAFELSNTGMIMVDKNGRLIKVNRSFVKFIGYPKKQLMNFNFKDITYQEDIDLTVKHHNDLITGKKDSCTLEKRYIHKSGKILWGCSKASLVRNHRGEPEYVFSEIQDITKQKLTQLALKQTEEKFSLMFNNANDAMLLVSLKENLMLDRVIETNNVARRKFGYTKKDFAAMPFQLLISAADRDKIQSVVKKLRVAKTVVDEFNAVTKGGEIIPFEFSARRFLLDGAKVLLIVARDITSRVKADTALMQANQELVRVSQYKSEFLANMSHEFRTPLTAVLALAKELLSKSIGPLNITQERYLQDIVDSGENLLHLINDLLDLSKIDSGKMELDLTEVQLGAIVDYVQHKLNPIARTKDIEIRVHIDGRNVVIGDSRKMRQVISNLVDNAIKFSPHQSFINIKLYDVSVPDEGTVIEISDNGPGIPLDHRELIFDAFYQVSRGLNKLFRGTGLGLALVKKIVELHKGSVDIDSRPGAGTTFRIFVPKYPVLDTDLD